MKMSGRSKTIKLPEPRVWGPCIITPGSYLDLSRLDRNSVKKSIPFLNRVFPRIVDLLGPFYARCILHTWPVHIEGKDILCELHKSSQAGEPSLIAFRHPGDADPHLVYYALTCMMKKYISGPKNKPRGPASRIKTTFLSGADLVMWGNPLVEWALCASSCVPVRHGGGEAAHMNRLLDRAIRDQSSLVLAPEGQISYHCQSEPDLDSGIAWLALRLQEKTGPGTPVRIVPLHLQYCYPRETWRRLDLFVSRLESLVEETTLKRADSGRAGNPGYCRKDFPAVSPWKAGLVKEDLVTNLRDRLFAVWDSLLAKAEGMYGLSPLVVDTPHTGFRARGIAIAEAAMSHVEAVYRGKEGLNLKSRIVNLRARIMDDILQDAHSGVLDSSIATCRRTEAFWLQRHIERADLLEYLDPTYAMCADPVLMCGPEGFTRLVETAQNLWDLAMRLAGGSVGWRSTFFRASLLIAAGDPVQVPEALPGMGETRKSRMAAIMDTLAKRFSMLIEQWKPGI